MMPLEFINETLKINLGWTLIHSIWQGAIILLIVKAALYLINKQNSSLRYLVYCAGLILIVATSIVTYQYLNWPENSDLQIVSGEQISRIVSINFDYPTSTPWINRVIQNANTWMPLLTSIWAIGVLVFSLRFLGGILYIHRLRKNIINVSNEWVHQLELLSRQIGFSRLITLAESPHIKQPIVVGYIKPIILLPIGLLSGLPQSHVEAILLHELSHIKRHDYLINLIQSLIEILLFFNPFVWIISNSIRSEREHCCDDQVIKAGLNPVVYVKALANLEEVRQRVTPDLALAFNNNKYQVFNRIKRIMETSVNHQTGKFRPIGLIMLAVAGLLCASWLTISSEPTSEPTYSDANTSVAIVADTLKERKTNKAESKGDNKGVQLDKKEKDNSKVATYSKRVITTYDEDGTPHEEVIEEFEGDEELRPMLSSPGSFSFSIPSAPSLPSIPSMPAIPTVPSAPLDQEFFFNGDTIPNLHFYSLEDNEKWEEFGKRMEEKFKHFGDENEAFGHQMEAWAERFSEDFDFNFDDDFDLKLEKLQDQLRELEFNDDFQFRLDEGLKDMEKHLEQLEETLKRHRGELKDVEKNMEEFETALHDQLVKDGYFSKGEKVNSMNWGDGKLSINGIKIKEADLPKYEALSEKYLRGKRGFYIHD